MPHHVESETVCRLYDATHLNPASPSKYSPADTEGLTLIADAIVLIGDEQGIWLSYDDPESDELLSNTLPMAEVASLNDAVRGGADYWASESGSLSVSRREATWKVTFGTYTTRRRENWWSLLVSLDTFRAMVDAFSLLAAENA